MDEPTKAPEGSDLCPMCNGVGHSQLKAPGASYISIIVSASTGKNVVNEQNQLEPAISVKEVITATTEGTIAFMRMAWAMQLINKLSELGYEVMSMSFDRGETNFLLRWRWM